MSRTQNTQQIESETENIEIARTIRAKQANDRPREKSGKQRIKSAIDTEMINYEK